MSFFIERFTFDQSFAGKEGNRLDGYKDLKAQGWDVTVLILYRLDVKGKERPTGEGVALGWKADE